MNLSHFCKKNGVKHINSAPSHPSTNGLVERAVQTFKQGMKKQGDRSVDTELARFLLSYRIARKAPLVNLQLSYGEDVVLGLTSICCDQM